MVVRSSSPQQIKDVKRIPYDPIGIYLRDYDIELIFANKDLADEFLMDFETHENADKPPAEQNCLAEGHEYKFQPITIMTSVRDALQEVIAMKSVSQAEMEAYEGAEAWAGDPSFMGDIPWNLT